MFGLDILVSLGNVAYLVSYSVRDILWLRILSAVGGLLLMSYYALQPTPLWVPFAWGAAFQAVNGYWIVKLLLERRPVHFTDEERRLYRTALRNLSERDAFKLFRCGTWSTAAVGTDLLTQGQAEKTLTLIVQGNASVYEDGKVIDTLGDGRFLGATAFLNKGADVAAPVTVTTTVATRVVAWPLPVLEAQFASDADLEIALEASLGLDLLHFVKSAWAQIPRPRLA